MAACISTDTGTGPNISILGAWNLKTLSGQPLPATYGTNSSATATQVKRQDITADKLVFNTDSTFSFATSFTNTFGDNHTETGVDSLKGIWQKLGAKITLTALDQQGHPLQNTLTLAADTSITYNDGRFTWFYKR